MKPHSLRFMAKGAFRRSLFGYRRDEVDEAVGWRDRAMEEESARAEAALSRAEALMARSAAEAKRADVEAARAFELEQASLELAAQVESLERLADRLAMRVVDRDLHVAKVSARLEVAIQALRNAEARTEDVDGVEAGAGDEQGDVFDGRVEVEVGPLSDFGQLASFEDAAGEIDAADEIAVKGFTEGRATLEMHLSEPIDLLRELEERAPFEFTVRDTRNDRVVLDVDAEAA